MANTILKYVNSRGIPCIESQSVELTSEAEVFYFNSHPFVSNKFQGEVFIKIAGTNSAPTTAVPIKFNTKGVSNSLISVYNAQGIVITTATFSGDGVYIGFYDSDTNMLRLLNN